MVKIEIQPGQIGIPQEMFTSEFSQTVHGQLVAKLIDRITRKENGPKLFIVAGKPHVETPIDYPAEAKTLVVGAHNRLTRLHQILQSARIPVIFASPNQHDQFINNGILSLSEEQARLALITLEAEDQGGEKFKQLSAETRQRMETAEQKKDLVDYLMWSMEAADQYRRRHDWMIIEELYSSLTGEPAPSIEDTLAEIEQQRPRFVAEARLVRRMHNSTLAALPDEDKIKVAILRLPAEVDRNRAPRALTRFPLRSISRYSDDVEEANTDASETYCITDAPCIHHSFDTLYKLTRRQHPDGKFEPRAFYVTSYSAQNAEGLADFPSAAQRFLEISFADDTPPIPSIRADMAINQPQVTFVRNPTIVRSEINSMIGNDGQAHFILGHDEHGNRITQDLIPYVMESLAGRVGNAYCIKVDQFFQ